MNKRREIIGGFFHEPVYIISNEEKKEVRNWKRIDGGFSETGFTWGYNGDGPHCLAYSILKELFGQKVAEQEYENLSNSFISKLDQRKGFRVSEADIMHILGIDERGRRLKGVGREKTEIDERGSVVALSAIKGEGGRKDYSMSVGKEQGFGSKLAALIGFK